MSEPLSSEQVDGSPWWRRMSDTADSGKLPDNVSAARSVWTNVDSVWRGLLAEYVYELAKAMDEKQAEIERLQRALGEQTARNKTLKNRAHTAKYRRNKMRADRDRLRAELDQVREELEDAQAVVIVASRMLDDTGVRYSGEVVVAELERDDELETLRGLDAIADTCSHGRPDHQELVRELREAVGLPGPPLPVTPKQAWEEAIARAETLRGIAKRLAEDWQPTVLWTGPKTYRFEWTNDEGEDDPMTEAEVHAIYGKRDVG